jgi:hypothetical protein
VYCPASASSNTVCPCHDSVFNGNGDRISGPAPRGLDHFAVSFSGTGLAARILVDPCTIVTDRAARALPP